MKLITQQLEHIGASHDNAVKFVDFINDTLHRFVIDTPLQVQHFIAQIMHESGAFHYTEEIATGQAYEGRVDLGNIQPGDGMKFKGRGLIQITGRANYGSLGNYFHEDFIFHPELLKTPQYAALSAGWFWEKHNLNVLADADDIEHITRKINGGLNGLEDRKNYLRKAKLFIPQQAPPVA